MPPALHDWDTEGGCYGGPFILEYHPQAVHNKWMSFRYWNVMWFYYFESKRGEKLIKHQYLSAFAQMVYVH